MFEIRNVSLKAFGLSLMTLVGMLALSATAQSQTLPFIDKDIHMGVATCAGSTCHGAVEPLKGVSVLQNEFITWQRNDQHAKAYQVLLSERSKRIARNLGLKSAETAPLCLDCHADNVPIERRHRTFQISDGVTCEACHGGAGRWIGTHISAAATHQVNIDNGLYPSADPISRAKLCLSCHFGDETRFVSHRIMGAGHPRMSFELDTFTAIQPAHFVADADYRKRKGSWNGVQVWAIGQAMSLDILLDALVDPDRGRDGIFPELVLFDCYSCHHRMSKLRWEPRDSVGLGPGIPRISDANMLMLRIIANRVDQALGSEFSERSVALHKSTRASTYGEMIDAANALRQVLGKLMNKFADHKFTKADNQALLAGIIESGLAGEYQDYPGAEQATMALSSIIEAMRQSGDIDSGQLEALNAALEMAYAALAKHEEYNSAVFMEVLTQFKTAAP